MSTVTAKPNDVQPTLEEIQLELQEPKCAAEVRQIAKIAPPPRKRLREVPNFVSAGKELGIQRPVVSIKDLFHIEVGEVEDELGKIEQAADMFQRFRDKGTTIYNWMVNQVLHFKPRMAAKVKEQGEVFLGGIYDMATGQTNQEAMEEADESIDIACHYGIDDDEDLQKMLELPKTDQARKRVTEFAQLLASYVSENARLGQVIFDLAQASNKQELMGILSQLEDDGVLRRNPQGAVKTFNKWGFSLVKDAFGPISDEAEGLIAAVVKDQTRQMATEYTEVSKTKKEDLAKQSKISPLALWGNSAAIEGQECFLSLPGVNEKDRKNGLLVAKSDKALAVLDACGAPSANFEALKKVCDKHKFAPLIFWSNLRTPNGRLVAKTHKFDIRVPDKIRNQDDRREFFDQTVFLTRWLLSALQANLPAEFQPLTVSERPEQPPLPEGTEPPMLSDEEWHFNKWLGRHTLCFKEWRWSFLDADGKVEEKVVLGATEILVERFKAEKGTKVKVVKWPAEAEHMLEKGGCLAHEGYYEGVSFNFDDPHFLLGTMCRKDFGNFMDKRQHAGNGKR